MKSKELIYKRLNREQNTDLGCWKGKEKTEFNCNFWLRKLRRPLSSPDLKYRFSKYVYKYTDHKDGNKTFDSKTNWPTVKVVIFFFFFLYSSTVSVIQK